MKIFHIIQGIENPSAGTTHSVGYLSHYLAQLNHDVTVVTLGNSPSHWPHNSSLLVFGGLAAQLGVASLDALRYVRGTMLAQSAILHGHGVWRVANLFPLLLHGNDPVKLVWSPRGMLAPWSWRYKAGRKRPFWHTLQRPALNKVHSFHATSLPEVEDIRRLGFKQPIALIPNGVEIPDLTGTGPRGKTIVFLSRIHEVKGLHLLIPAWSDIAGEFPDWEIRIAGKIDSDYGRRMVRMAQEIDAPRLTFLGEVLGSEKSRLLASALLFVLPTFSENFGIAIAEALAHATPVITTVETPWTELDRHGCGWSINPNMNDLKMALRSALSLPDKALESMGTTGRTLIENNYTWDRIAKMFEEFYLWVLRGDQKPSFIH